MKQYDFIKDPEKEGDEAITVDHTPKRKLDIGARFICLVIALFIWIYMVNIHDTDTTEMLTLKIDVVGVDALSANDDMMVYDMNKKTVNITVKGTNRDLKQYSDSEYKATVDVSKISTTGEHILDIVVKTPDNSTISFVSADPANVSVWSDYKISKDIPVEALVIGAENHKNFTATPSISLLKIEGPKGVLEMISVAVIEVGGNLLNGQIREDVTVKFYDALHKEIDSKGSLTYSTEGLSVSISAITPELEEE